MFSDQCIVCCLVYFLQSEVSEIFDTFRPSPGTRHHVLFLMGGKRIHKLLISFNNDRAYWQQDNLSSSSLKPDELSFLPDTE